jgi:CDP-6-deoxy-D-xylo-4-hexulose-3-dehydrase
LKEYVRNIDLKKFKIVEHVHNFGYYIGNFPDLKKEKILKIVLILNSLRD